MNNPVVQIVVGLKELAMKLRLFCQVCGKEQVHQGRTVGSWEEYTCPVCGNVQPFKVR